MGHTAAETSPKYGQPFFPRGLPQLEQLHHLQVKLCVALKDGIQLLELPVLDLSVLWISDYRSCSGFRGSYHLSEGSYSACSVGILGRPLLSALCAEVTKFLQLPHSCQEANSAGCAG